MSAAVLSIHKAEAVALALERLRAGELVIVPTDTVYGIACWPDTRAVARLYAVKQRDPEPALPLLLSRATVADKVAHLTPAARRLMLAFWPGPLTIIVPARPLLTRLGLGAHVGLRYPQTPALWPLLEAAGGYLVVSSAKRSGEPPAINAAEAAASLGDEVALILDGGPGHYGIPSTIVDGTQEPPTILRRGNIAEHDILKVLKQD